MAVLGILTQGQPLVLRVGQLGPRCPGARLLGPDVVDKLESLPGLLLQLLVPATTTTTSQHCSAKCASYKGVNQI